MKKLNCVFIILFIYHFSYGQNAYYDAITLKSLAHQEKKIIRLKIDTVNLALADRILGNYIPKDTLESTTNNYELYKKISNEFRTNPFFILSSTIQDQQLSSSATGKNSPKMMSSLVSTKGGINFTNFANGLANFMVNRFKEELSATFFNRFKNDLNDPKYQDMKLLFPQTARTLETIDKDIYQYSIYLNTLRQAFLNDLTNEYVNFQNLLKQKKYKGHFNCKQPIMGTVLYSTLYFINGFSSDEHPGEVLANFDPNSYINICSLQSVGDSSCVACNATNKNLQMNMRSSIKTLQLVSSSLRSKSTENYWITPDSARLVLNDPITFKIYLGLLYQKAKKDAINFSGNNSLISFLDALAKKDVADSLNQYRYFIGAFVDNAKEVDDYITQIKSKKKSEIDYNDYYNLFNSSLDLLKQVTSFIELPYVNLGDQLEQEIKNTSEKILYVARATGELYVDTKTQNYSSAILNVVTILDTLTNFDTKTRHSILKYGSFMAAIAQAQNSADVENAIKSVALPAGSYSIKQNSYFTFTVNGYMGYAGDFGPLPKFKNYMHGIYAPVGLSLSWGLQGAKRNWGAITPFISIIDIGGLAAYRLTNATDTLKQEIKLQSIISPSIQVLYEFPKTPLNICIGLRMTPSLFYSGKQTFETIKSESVVNASILIDIPFFTIYSGPRKK